MQEVTVVIPVGPSEANKRWLPEAVKSLLEQTHQVEEILLIDDMAALKLTDAVKVSPVEDEEESSGPFIHIWHSPWRLGIPHAFNFGIALARNELVFMLGSDDWLEPTCIEECVKAMNAQAHPERCYFFVGVRYDDGREEPEQFIACNAAMVTKSLWKRCGGFPIESTSGACDAALVSIMMKYPEAGGTIGVRRGESLYNCRVHQDMDTAQRGDWQKVILSTRDLVTRNWTEPDWTRRNDQDE